MAMPGRDELNFGAFGLKAMEPERITARQIEAARRAITRHIRRQGACGSAFSRTSRVVEARRSPHGLGQGFARFWVARVKPGRILFELDGVPGHLAKVAFERAAELPIKSRSSPAWVNRWLRKTNHGQEGKSGCEDRRSAGAQLSELKREQFNLRFQAATNQLEKPSRVREVRRTIARIKTLQTARASDAAKA